MNLKQALKRIEELERRVRELEGRPSEIHYHTYPSQPVVVPPVFPSPLNPFVPYTPLPWTGDPVTPPYSVTMRGH